jgi:hypothetical protein
MNKLFGPIVPSTIHLTRSPFVMGVYVTAGNDPDRGGDTWTGSPVSGAGAWAAACLANNAPRQNVNQPVRLAPNRRNGSRIFVRRGTAVEHISAGSPSHVRGFALPLRPAGFRIDSFLLAAIPNLHSPP